VESTEAAAHWNDRYAADPEQVSWFQTSPATSLELLDLLGVTPDSAVIDAGGGASNLVDRLVARGFRDVTVLDVSEAALAVARARVGDASVEWIAADLLSWTPIRRYDLWHDRAVLHFMTDELSRGRYLDVMRASLADDGAVIIATFADDGPTSCSGLEVVRYSADELTELLATVDLEVVTTRRELHATPFGTTQPFTWVAARSN
jgi:SAM-dependent methyltransferase